MVAKYPLQLKPFVKEVVWGGSWLAKTLGRASENPSRIGESWEAYSGSLVLNGEWKGYTLDELFLQETIWLAGGLTVGYPRFPLLAKFIDAHQNLSIQVHPDNDLAEELENYPYGKSEFWYILDAAPDAAIYYGLNGTHSGIHGLADALQKQEILPYLQHVPVQQGDLVVIPAGTIHALTEGVVVYELQQNSDITYRLYDWGRTDREIHLEKGLRSIDINRSEMEILHPEPTHCENYATMPLVEDMHFHSHWWQVKTSFEHKTNESSFLLLSVIGGSGRLVSLNQAFDTVELPIGTTLCLPAGLGFRLENSSSADQQPLTCITGCLPT